MNSSKRQIALLTGLLVIKLRDVFRSFTHRKVCYRSTALRVMGLFMRKDMRRASNRNARIGHKSAKKCLAMQWQENWVHLQAACNLCMSRGQISPHSSHLRLTGEADNGSSVSNSNYHPNMETFNLEEMSGSLLAQPPAQHKDSYESRLGCSGFNQAGSWKPQGSCPPAMHHSEEPTSIFLKIFLLILEAIRNPWNPLFSRLAMPSSLSLSIDRVLHPLTILVALCWAQSSLWTFILSRGPKTGCSILEIIQQGVTTSLDQWLSSC